MKTISKFNTLLTSLMDKGAETVQVLHEHNHCDNDLENLEADWRELLLTVEEELNWK